MSIIYSLIAKSNDKVLCEFTEYHGNFEQISRNLLKKVERNHRATFSYDDAFYFHYSNIKNITFMCMCDNRYPQQTGFKYLEELKDIFFKTFNQREIDLAISYCLNSSFKEIMKEKMDTYNKNENITRPNDTNYDQISIKDCNNPSFTNLKSEKINLIVKKVEFTNLKEDNTSLGKKSAKKLRNMIRLKRLKVIMIFIATVLIISYLLSIFLCGGFEYDSCRSE